MKVTLEMDVPRGYEPTGEYRVPVAGEIYFYDETWVAMETLSRSYSGRKIILRKTWVPPSWLPDGCWVYLTPYGEYFVSREEPKPHLQWFISAGKSLSVSAHNLAELHGESFVPPPYDKIQVKRA